jgi:hypothetical protein
LALSGCRGDDPDSDYRYHTAQWVVVNGTGDSYLRIVAPPRGYFHPNWDYSYGNGGYTAMAWTLDEVTDPDEAVPFERLLDCWRGWSEANIALELQWVDGTPIKLWRHADRDGEGRQFFDPSLWHHTATRHGHEVRDVWTFTILPEDIK